MGQIPRSTERISSLNERPMSISNLRLFRERSFRGEMRYWRRQMDWRLGSVMLGLLVAFKNVSTPDQQHRIALTLSEVLAADMTMYALP